MSGQWNDTDMHAAWRAGSRAQAVNGNYSETPSFFDWLSNRKAVLEAAESADTPVSTRGEPESASAAQTATEAPRLATWDEAIAFVSGIPGNFVDHVCAVCGGWMTEDEWDNRHSRWDGEDIHDRCCDCELS